MAGLNASVVMPLTPLSHFLELRNPPAFTFNQLSCGGSHASVFKKFNWLIL